MHGLPTIHKLNDAEARRIMGENGYDTSKWPEANTAAEPSPVQATNQTETFNQPEGE